MSYYFIVGCIDIKNILRIFIFYAPRNILNFFYRLFPDISQDFKMLQAQ